MFKSGKEENNNNNKSDGDRECEIFLIEAFLSSHLHGKPDVASEKELRVPFPGFFVVAMVQLWRESRSIGEDPRLFFILI